MDLVGFERARFDEVSKELTAALASIGATPMVIGPISARDGDNIAKRSSRTPWYDGPTVLSALDGFHGHPGLGAQSLRLPIQDVYKFDSRRILAGRVESGSLAVGDTLLFSPSNKTARVRSLEAWPDDASPESAGAGQAVGITLDEQLFVERGEMASHVENPPKLSTLFHARLFWLGHKPLTAGRRYKLKLLTQEAEITVQSIEDRKSEEHTSELQSLMRISYAVFCLQKKNKTKLSCKLI